MIATKTVDQVADLAAEQGYLERRPEYVAAVELGRTRTALFVPMLKENKLIGVFAVARQEVRPFTDKQIELVENFAQAVKRDVRFAQPRRGFPPPAYGVRWAGRRSSG